MWKPLMRNPLMNNEVEAFDEAFDEIFKKQLSTNDKIF